MRRIAPALLALVFVAAPVRAQEYAYGFSGQFFAQLLIEYADGSTQSFGASDQGWYSQTGVHSPGNTNYITGELSGNFYNSFFAFDAQFLQSDIFAASLRINTEIVSGAPTVSFFTYEGSLAALLGGTGGVGAFNDLASGILVGGRSYTTVDNDQWRTISLNSAGIESIEASGGSFALGATTVPVEVVPEPISMVLLGSGLFGVGAAARRRRNGELPA